MITDTIAHKIIGYLDKWVLDTDVNSDPDNPLTDYTYTVSLETVDSFYNDSVLEAEAIMYRPLNTIASEESNDYDTVLSAIYQLAASNLWNIHNIQTSTDGSEPTNVYTGRGYVLYNKAVGILQKYRRERLFGLNSME